MEFKVTRTSQWDIQPCKEAYEKEYNSVDERVVNDPTKIAAYGHTSDWWYEAGSDHRVEGGHIKRDFPKMGWFVTLDTLEDFVKFFEKQGDLMESGREAA